MNSSDLPSKNLQSELDELAYAGNLHWFHWIIVVLSAVLSFMAWAFLSNQVEERAQARFEREVSLTVEHVTERMRRYEDALWSGVAAIKAAGNEMTREQWRVFSESLHIDRKYPGINGIGVIAAVDKDNLAAFVQQQQQQQHSLSAYTVFPEHSEIESLPVIYIEPLATNREALGLDVAHEANRYTAAKNARDSGTAQITGPIILVQDRDATPGFLFYVPYYNSVDQSTLTAASREQEFVGMVFAPFVVKNLLKGALAKDKRHIGIKFSDAGQTIYDEHNMAGGDDFDPNPLFTKHVEIDLYGRTWVFDFRSALSFRLATDTDQPLFVLIGGLAIDGLLLTLFLMLSRASRRTVSFADRVSIELKEKATALARSNADLESFAYVASHDLKTPLRGIRDLTSYLTEDLETYFDSAENNPDVSRNLTRLAVQTQRMDNLISSILNYSSIGMEDEIENVDIPTIVNLLRLGLQIRDDQLQTKVTCSGFQTYQVRFQQVLSNLIENAFKYHHDRENAVVKIACKDLGDFYEFSVQDNGPGIDKKFHSRIFEAFQSLQSKDEVEGTGIGLAIVKKTVEGLGGNVRVSSVLGEGTTFTFTWPKVISQTEENRLEVS